MALSLDTCDPTVSTRKENAPYRFREGSAQKRSSMVVEVGSLAQSFGVLVVRDDGRYVR